LGKGCGTRVKKQKERESNQADFEATASKLNAIKPFALVVGYVAFLIWAWFILTTPKV